MCINTDCYNPIENHTTGECASCGRAKRKAEALYKWLLKNYAKEGDKIFDSHCGSGSICIAAHDYKFDLVATEIDEIITKPLKSVWRITRNN